MTVRKILGSINLPQGNHAVAKLDNGQYAVGDLCYGKTISMESQFPDLDSAFAHWSNELVTTSAAKY